MQAKPSKTVKQRDLELTAPAQNMPCDQPRLSEAEAPKRPKPAARKKRKKGVLSDIGSPTLITQDIHLKMAEFVGELEAYDEPSPGFEEEILLEQPREAVFGSLVGLPAVKFLSLARRVQRITAVNPGVAFPMLNQELAGAVLNATSNGDHVFFEHLALLIKMGSKRWLTAKPGEFGIKQNQNLGRKSKQYDLKRVGVIAIYNRVWARIYGDRQGRRPIHLMRRDELRKEIQRLQTFLGLRGRMTISESDLSRLITSEGVAHFMEPRSNQIKSELETTSAAFYGP